MSQGYAEMGLFDGSINMGRPLHQTHQGAKFGQHLIDMSGSGQVMVGSHSTGGAFMPVQGTPSQNHPGLSKYGSSVVRQHNTADRRDTASFDED